MYLKSLEVHGFKSFANKLVFEFHNGITAIVGPNGSGKSNVADAVRWVLGEQSARQLRGARMEDVIFAGTQMRKPLGYAYVAITINNEDHKLNVPYEEVKIARRVYRSGESEYLLNGASCRLKDVQELLLDTGIGKEGYSIIGQGQIDRILSGKPEERRELFDEAAGIVKYKKRKAAAEKNLEEERQNLVRIEDVLAELEKQVGPLEEQSTRAKEYLAYRDELRNLDINLFLWEYDKIQEDMESFQEKRRIAAGDLEEAAREYDKTKEEYVTVEAELDGLGRSLEQQRELLSVDKLSLNQSEGDIKVFHEQILALRQNKEHNQELIHSLQERMENADAEKAGYLAQKQQADEKRSALLDRQSALEKKLDEMGEQALTMEIEINQCNEDVIDYLNKNTDVKTDEQRMKTLLEQNQIKSAEMNKQMLENKTEASVLEELLAQEEKALTEITEKIGALDDAAQECKNTERDLEKKRENLVREHRDTQQQFHMENSRLASLRNLTERYEGYGQSIKRVMEQKKQHPGIVGVVADIIRVQKVYEVAVETALGGSIQNIVTDNEQTAKEMIAFLKKNRFGRATFLPLTNMKARPVNLSGGMMSEPGVIGMASELVEADAQFQNLIQYLLGRFVVVDNIDHAITMARKYHHTVRIVTTEGELLNPGGSMSGGAFKNSNNLLGRRREMEDLQKRTADLQERLHDISSALKANDAKKEEVVSQIRKSRKIRQELVLQQNTAKLNYDRAQEDREKNREKLDFIRLEKRQLEERIESLHRDMEKIAEQMQSNEEMSRQRREQMDTLTLSLEDLKRKQEKLSAENSELLLEISAQEQSGQFVEENLERVSGLMSQLKQELEDTGKSGEDADRQVEQKEKEITSARDKIQDLKRHMEELTASIEEVTGKREELTSLHKGFFEKREELAARKGELDRECYRLDSQLEKLSDKRDAHVNYMWEQYEMTYHAAEENRMAVELSPSRMKEEIARLKGRMKGLGDVNINAIEQFREVQERYEHLHGQHDDLIEAAQVLEGIIEELDTEMRRQFESQFGEIRARFDKVFRELFGGGRGTLELTEEEDILEAGIRIVAQPPGKKLQNMMQLSGGEKALTAIALLFAIQSLKPSPFCLLDEIEAALDDSNVNRYADYLHKLTKDTQFIVITHRRGTMNASDVLYGITMQEKGISTLVSVNLLDEKEIAK